MSAVIITPKQLTTRAQGSRIVDYMQNHGLQSSDDDSDAVTLCQFTYGTKDIFGMLERDPMQKQIFDQHMSLIHRRNREEWYDIYPVTDRLSGMQCNPTRALVVDIGGGAGRTLVQFQQRQFAIPHGRLILQELSSTIQAIENLPDGIEAMEHDFFTPQPIQGMSCQRGFKKIPSND